jgi:hypothetical protein
MNGTTSRSCTIRLAAEGVVEECAPERCGFWEPGGAVVPAGCLIDRLGVDIREPGFASSLLFLRQDLKAGSSQTGSASFEALHRPNDSEGGRR